MPQSDSTCWTMIQLAAEGRQAERQEFACRYEPIARAYLGARWRNTPLLDSVDDTVQEMFVQCFKQGGALERVDPGRPGGFRAFLYGVLRRLSMDIERRRAAQKDRQPPVDFGPFDDLENDEPSLSRVFDRAWAESLLREAIERLMEQAQAAGSDNQVKLLRLRLNDGLSIREIARRWETDPAPLYREFAKVRGAFKAALMDVVAFHHPGTPAEIERACVELLSFLD